MLNVCMSCCLSKFGQQVGLQISMRKMEVMTLNVNAQHHSCLMIRPFPAQRPLPILDQSCLMTRPFPAEIFTYLGSIVRQDGCTNKDIQSKLSKVRNAFRSLNAVWKSSQYSIKTKLKLYQSCILSTLLYGAECWRMTQHDLAKLSSFYMRSLRKIQRIFW